MLLNLAAMVRLLLVPSVPVMLAFIGWLGRWAYRRWRSTLASAIASAEADAKDELIDTLQANHQALSNRVELLEKKASGLDKALTEAYGVAEDLQSKLAATLDRYTELQKYTAPEAVKALTVMAHTANALLVDVLERLTSIESQQNTGLQSLAQALDLLRQQLSAVAPEGPSK